MHACYMLTDRVPYSDSPVLDSKSLLAPSAIYHEELSRCGRLLNFPEEVALILTQTEFRIFNEVPPASYVRHVGHMTLPLPDNSGQHRKSVRDLDIRFHEVSLCFPLFGQCLYLHVWYTVLFCTPCQNMMQACSNMSLFPWTCFMPKHILSVPKSLSR